MSVECMSHVLLHPDLSAEVKVDLLNSDLVPCPSCDPDPSIKSDNTTLTSDRWRRGIQVCICIMVLGKRRNDDLFFTLSFI